MLRSMLECILKHVHENDLGGVLGCALGVNLEASWELTWEDKSRSLGAHHREQLAVYSHAVWHSPIEHNLECTSEYTSKHAIWWIWCCGYVRWRIFGRLVTSLQRSMMYIIDTIKYTQLHLYYRNLVNKSIHKTSEYYWSIMLWGTIPTPTSLQVICGIRSFFLLELYLNVPCLGDPCLEELWIWWRIIYHWMLAPMNGSKTVKTLTLMMAMT